MIKALSEPKPGTPKPEKSKTPKPKTPKTPKPEPKPEIGVNQRKIKKLKT